MSDVTRILLQIENGDPHAADELLPLVYQELRALAKSKLAHEKAGQTLQATALVHEAYLRLVAPSGDQSADSWNSRGHFFAAAAEAMRRILIEAARRKQSEKHGGQFERAELPDIGCSTGENALDLLALDEALGELERIHPQHAQVVKLRFFAGLTLEQTAAAAGVARATAERRWIYARAWLFGRLREHAESQKP